MGVVEEIAHKVLFPVAILGQDVSITTLVLLMWLAVFLVFFFFFIASRRVDLLPSGMQIFAEYLISLIDEYVFVNIEVDRRIWLSFLVALFSFILVSNLLGLVPGFTSPSSDINFTATLAVIVFIIVQAVGIRKKGLIKYLSSLVPADVPLPIKFMLFPIELIGQVARPFSLAVRLFANLFAGHMVLLSVIGLILVFRNHAITPFPLIGAVLISAFEMFVAFIQAFIFTFLTSLYIGEALGSEH
ncbi:MAG: F0F1 ATP synthase subunit A [Candidatus Margulisbacteria bacterium]|nr:F0F1 ATP synthase subunit A [Candidatus Margulisiibacteriota bacterium]